MQNTDVLGALEKRIQERHLLGHPLYQAWSVGGLSQASLQEYAKQYYHHVEAFPTYVSAVHTNCPQLPVRQQLLENLIEEERGADNHPELWLRFAEALGVLRDEVLGTPPFPETRRLIESFRSLTREHSYLAGMTALFAYEAQIPEVAATNSYCLPSNTGPFSLISVMPLPLGTKRGTPFPGTPASTQSAFFLDRIQ